MAEISGFFPSTVANPRKYGNDWLNKLLNCVVTDGVFATPQGTASNYLQVVANSGLTLTIKAGWGRFEAGGECYFYQNESDTTKTLINASGVDRTDYIVVRVDRNESVKRVYIDIKTGNQSTGQAPTLVNTGYIHEYLLASIQVGATATAITQDKISDKRGTSDCPWVTSLVQQVDVSTLMTQFDTAFWNWYNNVTENISGTVMVTQRSAEYISVSANQTVIMIPTSLNYANGDLLTVYIEGRAIIKDIDYTINSAATQITLVRGLDVVGTSVMFEALKNIDVSDVESYVTRLTALEDKVSVTQITNDNGSTRYSVSSNLTNELSALPVGMYTFYSGSGKTNNPKPTANWRGIYHKTSAGVGWCIAISHYGDVYSNQLTTTWQGWRCIYDVNQAPLWSGAFVMNASQTITPSKKISQCRNGWILLWSGYDNGTIDGRIVTQVVPKISVGGSIPAGLLYYQSIPTTMTASQNSLMTAKAVYISDTTVTGHASNTYQYSNYFVLRAVLEY